MKSGSRKTGKEISLSVVIPAFNEAEVLPLLFDALRPVLDSLPMSYEVIVVDDGSSDGTSQAVEASARSWSQLRLGALRHNSGHQAALTAGLDLSRGEWVVTMDADLQDPPSLLPTMLEAATRTNSDVVYAVRGDRSRDSWFKRQTAAIYYAVMDRVTGSSLARDAGDFRLMHRRVIRELQALPERRRVYRLLVPWLDFPSTTVQYERAGRAAGRTKYPMHKMIALGFDSLTAFSSAPLRIATWAGLGTAVLCISLTLFALLAYFFGATVPGWASVFVAVLFVGAVQLICMGLLGEYLARVFIEVQARPLYSLREPSARYDAKGEVTSPEARDDIPSSPRRPA